MKEDLFLEEAVLDDLAVDLDALELPLNQRVFQLIGATVFIIVFFVGSWIISLNFFQGGKWKERALFNVNQVTIVRPERGLIVDRYDQPLTKNIPTPRVIIRVADLIKDFQKNEPILSQLESILELPPNSISDLIKEINLEKQNLLTLKTNLTVNQVLKIKNLNLSWVQIDNDFQRQYPYTEIFSHILGFVGLVSKEDLKNNSALFLNDVIGKSGLEAYYDKDLRGQNGEIINYRNAKGEMLDKKLYSDAVPGAILYTTIDSGLQIHLYNSLKKRLEELGKHSGAGLVLNPQSGEVLALVSLPSFDNNKISDKDLKNPYRPFLNRVISGLYSPGSTIKPLVAIASLKEGIIRPEDEIFSRGYLEIANPYNPEAPSRFVDWKPHGWVNLYSAIARSSNVYFYVLGGGLPKNEYSLSKRGEVKGLGISKLKEYWQLFGLSSKTGIDLPGEKQGFLPDPDIKMKNTKDIWRLGDTYNVSIGQGDLMITPLELLNYISVIGNGGKLMRPFIVKKIFSQKGLVIKENHPEVLKDYSLEFKNYFKEVERGMIDAVSKSYGSAYALSDLPIQIAGKTGSAQIYNNKKTNALFVGYLPVDFLLQAGIPLEKQIAVLILIEEAEAGSVNTLPVAKEIFKWYYENRIKSSEVIL